MIVVPRRASSRIILTSKEQAELKAFERELSQIRSTMKYRGYILWKYYIRGIDWVPISRKEYQRKYYKKRRKEWSFRDKKIATQRKYLEKLYKDPVRLAHHRKMRKEAMERFYAKKKLSTG